MTPSRIVEIRAQPLPRSTGLGCCTCDQGEQINSTLSSHSSSSHRETPTAPTPAGAESFGATARWATIGSGIFCALFNRLERAQSQPQFAHLFFARPLRALAVAAKPGPEKRRIPGLRGRYDPELLEASAAELFLHLGALHEGHTAHLHGAPDHSCRVTPLLRGHPLDSAPLFPQFRFSNYAGHFQKNFLSFSSVCGKSLRSQAEKDRGKSCTAGPGHRRGSNLALGEPSYRICYTARADLHDVPRSSDSNWSWLQRFPIGSNPLLVMAWDASGEARNLMSA